MVNFVANEVAYNILQLYARFGGTFSLVTQWGIVTNLVLESLKGISIDSNGTNSHPKLHRSITPREAARIQSFSDNYIFYGNKTSVCRQIGNAVPPLLALALGKAILKSLRK
ncbi:DNA cytosine methyltransferase [Helicobacter pylori]|nr:DNA cytosine methyltransferase [Helicobacter pylori]